MADCPYEINKVMDKKNPYVQRTMIEVVFDFKKLNKKSLLAVLSAKNNHQILLDKWLLVVWHKSCVIWDTQAKHIEFYSILIS